VESDEEGAIVVWTEPSGTMAAATAKKSAQRSTLSREISMCCKFYGPDPSLNHKLATLLAGARKAGIPKASIEAALARGQGKSASGVALEAFTLEAMIPPNVSVIIETETDNKNRTMMDLKNLVTNKYKGNATPTNYLFQRRGRVEFEKDEKGSTVDDVLDEAIEAGADDVESDEEGAIVVWTEPSGTMAAATALQKSHGLKVESMDILWDANEDTKVVLDEDAAKSIAAFLREVRETPNVEGVYANVRQGNLHDNVWDDIQDKLDA